MFTPSHKAAIKMKHSLRRGVPSTPLDNEERYYAQSVWTMQLGTRATLDSIVVLFQLMERLQIPMQPVIRSVVEAAYEDNKTNFSFSTFCSLIEQCKTLHTRWLHKIRGKHIDDDVLEAFVAAGGSVDSSGSVDVTAVNKMLADFNLALPEIASPQRQQPSPSRGRDAGSPTDNANSAMEFSGFVDLLRTDRHAGVTEFSSQLFLKERDLDDEKSDAGQQSNPASRSQSRRQSLQKGGLLRNLPPLSHHHTQQSQPNAASSPPKRSLTSMSGHYDRSADRSVSPLRHASSKATGVSRLPQINRQKREKKHKFANW